MPIPSPTISINSLPTQTDAASTADSGIETKEYSLGYIPALDGLRAISILLVLAFHDIGPVTSEFGHKFNGWIGVDVFFVISGFLITSILLKEGKQHAGEFSLRKFYTRRWLRIAPVYYAFLLVVAAWHFWGGNHHIKPFICAALYLTNLDLAFSWNLIPLKLGISHLWSLGLEEQFYLVWPACLKFVKQKAIPFVSAIIAIVYCWRLYLVAHGASWIRLVHGFDTKVDTIMIGVLMALLLANPAVKARLSKVFSHWILQPILFGLTFWSFNLLGHPMNGGLSDQLFFWGVKLPAATILITSLLLSVLFNPKALVASALANPVAVFIGKLSYSLYLWHPLVHSIYCGLYWDYFCKHGPKAELYQYLWIFAVACASYYLIERPFLKLKTKFS